MRAELRSKIIEVCDRKIALKGDNVGLSFYAFFASELPTDALRVDQWASAISFLKTRLLFFLSSHTKL
ncbi:DUF6500 family protein [Shewanella sp. MEBiC00475]|uniref:DUF6500 family protein n=1 Tax=Shewanella sp. MEBiC00475 TaxID=2575361 RepID=UPI0010C021C4|nr:DUF6500 family protein [Shewanella sp. MEBiC00475]